MTSRNITFQGKTLPDPDPGMNIDDVRKLYASQYPALNNAVIVYPENKENAVEFTEKTGKSQSVEFKPSVGRKG